MTAGPQMLLLPRSGRPPLRLRAYPVAEGEALLPGNGHRLRLRLYARKGAGYAFSLIHEAAPKAADAATAQSGAIWAEAASRSTLDALFDAIMAAPPCAHQRTARTASIGEDHEAPPPEDAATAPVAEMSQRFRAQILQRALGDLADQCLADAS